MVLPKPPKVRNIWYASLSYTSILFKIKCRFRHAFAPIFAPSKQKPHVYILLSITLLGCLSFFELPEGFSVTAEKWQQQGMFRVARNLSGYSESLAAGLPLRSRATCSNLVVFLVYSLYFMPYNLILLYSVVRPMPSNAAANLQLPFAYSSARIICFFSMSSISNEASDVNGISSSSNVSAMTVSPSVCSTAKCTTRFSSLTLPPHV